MTKVPTNRHRRLERTADETRPHRSSASAAAASPIDIVLLGLIHEEPRNAYDVSKVIRQRNLRSWIRISDASVYRNLRQLAADGFLSARTVRDGLLPEKTVFSITRAGRAHLAQLVAAAADEPVALHFDFDVWLAHLGHLDADEAQRCIDQLATHLDAADVQLSAMLTDHAFELPPGVRALMELRRDVLAVTRRWLDAYPTDSFGARP